MAQNSKKKAFKVTPASKRRSRGDVIKQVALGTELKPGKVKEVLAILTSIMAADLSKKGVGEFNFNGLVRSARRTSRRPRLARAATPSPGKRS